MDGVSLQKNPCDAVLMDSIQQMSGKVKSLTDKLMARVKYVFVDRKFLICTVHIHRGVARNLLLRGTKRGRDRSPPAGSRSSALVEIWGRAPRS